MDEIGTILNEIITKIEEGDSKYKCEICNKILSSKRNLEWHILNVCKYSHKCEKCNKSFGSNNYLLAHKKKCIGILKCPKCCKILSRKQTYLKHVEKCMGC